MPIRRLVIPVAPMLCLSAVLSASAATPRVQDEGAFFSPAAIEKANQRIGEIHQKFKKDLLIETVSKVPLRLRGRLESRGKNAFFQQWASTRARDADVNGIYILICAAPIHLQIDVDDATRTRAFTPQDRDQLTKTLMVLLDQKQNDAAVGKAVDFVFARLNTNLGPAGSANPEVNNRAVPDRLWIDWAGLAILGLVGLWALVGIIRAVIFFRRGQGDGLVGALMAGIFGQRFGKRTCCCECGPESNATGEADAETSSKPPAD